MIGQRGEGMGRKEYRVCIWIHHIATILGVCGGLCNLACTRKYSFRTFCLSLFTGSQLWALLKIVSDGVQGRSRLKKSIVHIRALSSSAAGERRALGALTAASAVFKIVSPAVIGHY